MKPCIGVVSLYDVQRKSYWMLPDYLEGIKDAGGVPVILPQTIEKEDIEQIIDKFDGFLFAGGQDIEPLMYGEEKRDVCGEICDIRDTMEKELYSLAIKRDKPTLGVCRGMQLLNVVMGGTLYQDLKTDSPSQVEHCQKYPYDVAVHKVKISVDTPLYSIIEKSEIDVNSYHHQAVKELASSLKIMAQAEDGIIEAVYTPKNRYALAVQWHPEMIYKKDDDNKSILLSFIKACKNIL